VAVKIKLKRLGKIRAPYYRIVVADSRTKRDGRAIEEIGKYHPKAEPSLIEVNSERAQHWLKVGAQPTDPVRKILEVTGDWQKFKGLPGAEGTLKTAGPKEDKKVAFAAAVAESLTESGAKTKSRGKASDARAADAKAGDGKAADAKAADAKAEKPARAEKPAKADKPARAKKSEDAEAAPAKATEAADATPTTEAAATTEAPAVEAAAAEAPAAEAPAEEPAAEDSALREELADAKASAEATVAADSEPPAEDAAAGGAAPEADAAGDEA
jgi:small subunit ribosomal protein S16